MKPIIIKQRQAKEYEYVEEEWTYDKILDLFDDDGNLVRPLVLRCIEYEEKIRKLVMILEIQNEELQRLRDQLSYC